MLRRSRIAVAATTLSIATFALAAQAAFKVSSPGTITFKAKAPAVSFSGPAKGATVKEDGDNLVFSTTFDQIDFGMRKNHAYKGFKASDKTPVLVTVKKSSLKVPEAGKTSQGTVPATVSIGKGSTAALVCPKSDEYDDVDSCKKGIKYSASNKDGKIVVNASFAFDYKKVVPEICNVICVKPLVHVDIANLSIENK